MTAASTEVRVVDPKTGGAKGRKLERFDLIPMDALEEVARVYGKGAEKYDDNNWLKGYKWSLSFGALLRHVAKWMLGEDYDNGEGGTGCHHLACAAWHCLALMTFQFRALGTDDRKKRTLILPAEAAPAVRELPHAPVEARVEKADVHMKTADELPEHRPVGWFRSVGGFACLNNTPEGCGRSIPDGQRIYATGEPGGILCEACAAKRVPLNPPDFDPPRCGAV